MESAEPSSAEPSSAEPATKRPAEPEKPDSAPIPGTCVADATRIPAREESAQHSLSIAHAVRPDPDGGLGGRPVLHREPVAARVGSETRIRDALEKAPIQALITDGKMKVDSAAERTARCRWHLPRSVRFLLYEDEVTGSRNEALTDSIRSVVHADYPTGHAAKSALTRWAAVCRLLAPRAATTVERAAKGIVPYAETPDAFCVDPECFRDPPNGKCVSSIVGSKTGGNGPALARRTCCNGTRSTGMTRSGGPDGSPARSRPDYDAVSQC